VQLKIKLRNGLKLSNGWGPLECPLPYSFAHSKLITGEACREGGQGDGSPDLYI
jgi:hypothetical protein